MIWIPKPGAPGGPVERALHRAPIRRDLYAPSAGHSGWADDVNPFEESSGFNQRGEWMALFTDIRPLWAAAWIDGRDYLRRAYGKVLAVKDANRRQALRAALADLPITMGDVEALRCRRGELDAAGADVNAWKAEQRLAWASRFREHYAAVAAEAAGE